MSSSFNNADRRTYRKVMAVGLLFCTLFVGFSFFAREQAANTYVLKKADRLVRTVGSAAAAHLFALKIHPLSGGALARHTPQRPCDKIPYAKHCSGKGPIRKFCIPLRGVEQCSTLADQPDYTLSYFAAASC